MRLGLRSVRSAVSTATSRSGAVSFRTGPRLNIPEGERHDIPGKSGPMSASPAMIRSSWLWSISAIRARPFFVAPASQATFQWSSSLSRAGARRDVSHRVTRHAMTLARGAAVGEGGRGCNGHHQGPATAAIGRVKRVLVVMSLCVPVSFSRRFLAGPAVVEDVGIVSSRSPEASSPSWSRVKVPPCVF